MAGLGETIDRLARQRRVDEAQRPPRSTVGAAPGRMTPIKVFGDNPGSLRMFLQAPSSSAIGAPLVVALHGCGQGAEQYAHDAGWLALAKRLDFAVLAPEQGIFNNFNRCFNWFAPGDVTRGKGEVASIAAMVGYAVRTLGLDPRRVFVTGLSAGGAMATALLATYPALFAGGAIIAGIPYGVSGGMRDGLKLMRQGDGRGPNALGDLVRQAADDARPALRLSIWQGDADTVVNPANGREIADQWIDALGLPHEPAENIALPQRRRMVWDAASGGSTVELNLITGMGHGAPLSTLRAGDVGRAAPYMLETGISSTLEIAGFWDLARTAAPAPIAKPRDKPAKGLLSAVAKAFRKIGARR